MATPPVKEARNHHYIPQAYLRGFGWKRGKKNWYVNALNLKEGGYFQPNTRNVCAERDFLRVEVEGQAPDALEKAMGQFETEVRTAILRVDASKTFTGDDRIVILNLMALLAVRSPQMRENMRDFQERVLKQMMGLTLATKERWEGQIRQMKEAGHDLGGELSYEELKEFHEKDQYKIEVRREFHIGSEFKIFETVLDLLVARKWKLYVAAEGQGTFVTSDHPVTLTWNHPDRVPLYVRHSPGFGMIDTEVTFPLTKTSFLLGRFEGMEEGVEEAYGAFIGACNTRTVTHAFDLVFTADKSFPYFVPPNEYYFDDEILETLKRRASQVDEADAPQAHEWNAESGPPFPRAFGRER